MLLRIFMFATVLIVPITMVAFGRVFMRSAPNEINSIFGYRTVRSMQNKDTWVFAHRYFGKIWFIGGLVLLPVSAIAMIFTLGQSEHTVSYVGAAICLAQLVLMALAIIPTEVALKKNFDTNGQRK